MEIGQLIGRFRIQRQIGRGGMGDIYLALDTMNFRNVAVKVLPRLHHSSRVLIARFLREMEVCKRLSHPNVVQLIDAGNDRDTYYMALEYVHGISLDDLIAEKGQIPVEQALSFMQDISFALHAAHTQHIIHRDVKPSNVMITKDDHIKLIDFGIAQSKDEEIHKRIRSEMDRLSIRFRESELSTSPGAIIGTPCYNSPEQNKGRPTTYASDIYSLGLVFYEMFTGVQVLPNQTLPKIVEFQARLDAELIPPSQLVPDIPAEIESILMKMIRFDPDERFDSAGELVTALSRATIAPEGAEPHKDAAGKMLAQLELSETHYARAENYLAEGKYHDALSEFEDLLSLPIRTERYYEFIEKWLIFLVSVLRVSRKRRSAEEEQATHQVASEEFVKVFSKICALFGNMGRPLHRRLVEERLVESLPMSEQYDQVLSTYDELLNAFPEERILQRGYSQFLFKNGAASAAKRIQYDIINRLLDKDQLEGALDELRFILEMDSESSRAQQEVQVLEAEVSRRAQQVEEFFAEMRQAAASRDPDWQIETYRGFLEKFPGSTRALVAIHDLQVAAGRQQDARDTLAEIAIEDYFQKRPTTKDNFIKCLHLDKGYSLAHLYLAEIYRQEGASFSRCDSYSDLVVNILSMVGMFEECLEEYTKRLKDSLDDIATYEKMLDLLKRLGQREKLFEVYLEMGKCALKHDRVPLAKEYFDQTIERCPDPNVLYNRLREIPNINKVYNLVKLHFQVITRRSATGLAKDGKQTRGLSTFVAGFRKGEGE